MTRTAADVEAELEALELESSQRAEDVLAAVRARPKVGPGEVDTEAVEMIDRSLRLGLKELDAINALRVEHGNLLRAELDAATPPDIRDLALSLRRAHRFAGAHVVDAGETWESLATSEAAAWAAVAREAGRG